MKSNSAKVIGLVAALGCVGASSAQATVHTINLEFSNLNSSTIEPFFSTPSSTDPGRLRIFGETSGNGPFSIAGFEDGDTISFNVTILDGGLTLQDNGNPFLGANEGLSVPSFVLSDWVPPSVLDTNDPPVIEYDVSTVLTLTGVSGSTNGTVFSSSTFRTLVTPNLSNAIIFDITSSMATITSFNVSHTFSNIAFLNDLSGTSLPSAFSGNTTMIALDDTNVPAPGALALLGLGLLGISVRRRVI